MNNAKRRKRWRDDHKTWSSDIWKNAIWSPTSGRDYVWRTPKEGYNPECPVPIVKHGRGSVKIWAAMPWYSAGPIITLNGWITTSDYMEIWDNQVHPTVQILFAKNYAIFQHENSPTRSHKCSVLVWGAWRCISTSTMTSTMARIKYHRTTVVSFSE
jgi:hypothetical protein